MIERLIGQDTVEFEMPGNKLCREAYHTFPMPWAIKPAVEGFQQESFQRLEWDRHSRLSDGEHFFLGDKTVTMDEAYESVATSSMITRWREGNKQLAYTKDDVAIKAFDEIRSLVGKEEVLVGRDCVLLLFRRS